MESLLEDINAEAVEKREDGDFDEESEEVEDKGPSFIDDIIRIKGAIGTKRGRKQLAKDTMVKCGELGFLTIFHFVQIDCIPLYQ